jgi:hypothetical protein
MRKLAELAEVIQDNYQDIVNTLRQLNGGVAACALPAIAAAASGAVAFATFIGEAMAPEMLAFAVVV